MGETEVGLAVGGLGRRCRETEALYRRPPKWSFLSQRAGPGKHYSHSPVAPVAAYLSNAESFVRNSTPAAPLGVASTSGRAWVQVSTIRIDAIRLRRVFVGLSMMDITASIAHLASRQSATN